MPSVYVTGSSSRVATCVASFVANLPELLCAMAADPRCLIAIGEFADDRYVQFWVSRDGMVVSEVISNFTFTEGFVLSAENEMQLRRMGWQEPSGAVPNWQFTSNGVIELFLVSTMIRDVVYDVMGEQPDSPMWLRSWMVQDPSLGHSCGASVHPRGKVRNTLITFL